MKRWLWLIPILLAIVVYAPAPWGDLVWDDVVIFERQLVAINGIRDALFPPEGIWGWTYVYYRPVVVLSYLLDVGLYGRESTVGPHLSNVFYHVIATFFIWILARRFFLHLPNGAAGAVVAASIFAVHPIHTESVNWIAGRGDMLATVFLLPSMTLTLVWRDRREVWALTLAVVLYLLALLSKELAVAALVLVPATLFLVPRRDHPYDRGTGELVTGSMPTVLWKQRFFLGGYRYCIPRRDLSVFHSSQGCRDECVRRLAGAELERVRMGSCCSQCLLPCQSARAVASEQYGDLGNVARSGRHDRNSAARSGRGSARNLALDTSL